MSEYIYLGWIFVALSILLMVGVFKVHKVMHPNAIGVMYLFHIIQQFGASLVFLNDPGATIAEEFFLACSVVAVMIPAGGILASFILPASRSQLRNFRYQALDDSAAARNKTWSFFLLYFMFCVVLFVLYIRSAGSSPLIGLLTGDLSKWNAVFAREDAGAGSVGLMFGIGLRFFMPFLFVFALLGFSYFRSYAAKGISIAAILMAFTYNAWATDKTPVAMLFLLALIILVFKRHEGGMTSWYSKYDEHFIKRLFVGRRRRVVIIGAIVAVLMFSYPVFVFLLKPAGELGLSYVIEHVFLRIIWKPAVNSYAAFEAFSTIHPHTWFADIRKLAVLAGWEYVDLSQLISLHKGMSADNNAPPPAIGNFYAQGGWPVLIFGVLLASFIFKIMENMFFRTRVKTIVHVAAYALLLFGAFRFSWANFHTILATEVIGPMVLILVSWSIFRRFRLGSDRAHSGT